MIAISRIALFTSLLLVCSACSETADSGSYAEITEQPSQRAALLTASCSGCHAEGGTALVDIHQFSAEEIASSLQLYRSEEDGTTVMHRLTRGYTDDDIIVIADYLGRKEGR